MLTVSDNDLAEALARHVAIATDRPPTFSGGTGAVRSVLASLGVPTAGMAMLDGSGLSRQDRVPARALAAVLALDASPAHPRLRAVLSGLPIAGFTGTLDEDGRFGSGSTLAGAGLVRAKTGSLTGVDTLAGIARDSSGGLLVFAFMSNGNDDATAADATLDRMAVAMLHCGCR
jgi:D-alanyl-D-alanine carboxypeptidase/D-alanyl-D-alanine-endopeptidase (penicillin-binding protein 4)